MQILVEEKEVSRLLGNLTISLAADPESWGGWQAVTICAESEKHQPLDTAIHSYFAHVTRAALLGLEGVILQLGSNSLLAVVQGVNKDQLKTLRHDIEELSPGRWAVLTFRHFNLLEDTETLEEYARIYATSYDRLNTVDTVEFESLKAMVPHISDLLKAWMATHKTRQQNHKPCVLLVDDDASTRHIVSRALKNDYPMVTAGTVPEAIEKHLLLKPDIVFLDIDMPGCDGFMLLSYIHAYDPNCRVVMFSSNGYVDNRLKAFAAGAIGFVKKPFKRDAFYRYIDMCKPRMSAAT